MILVISPFIYKYEIRFDILLGNINKPKMVLLTEDIITILKYAGLGNHGEICINSSNLCADNSYFLPFRSGSVVADEGFHKEECTIPIDIHFHRLLLEMTEIAAKCMNVYQKRRLSSIKSTYS